MPARQPDVVFGADVCNVCVKVTHSCTSSSLCNQVMASDNEGDSDSQPNHLHDRLPLGRRDYLQYTGAAAVGSLTATGSAVADEDKDSRRGAGDGTPPTDLRVEYEHQPNNLAPDGTPPRFFWEVSADRRGTTQTAYRLLVADSASKLRNENGNIWDSGRVESTQSTGVEYEGSALDPNTTYYWMVCIWNQTGSASDWSAPSTFTTAISESGWMADWVRADLPNKTTNFLGTNWTDYTYETEFTIEQDAASLVFRAADRDNCYMWQFALASYGAVDSKEHLLRAHVKVDGSYTLLDEISINNTLAGVGERNQVRVTISGSEITTVINGETVDNRTDNTHTSGTVGFRQYGSERAAYDTVHITTSDGTTLFKDAFADGKRDHFSRGTVRNDHLRIGGAGMGSAIVIPYTDLPLFPRRDPCPLLRTEFEAEKEIRNARVHISGLGFYELYLNGDRIGNSVLDPARTNYTETVLYSTYNVADQLASGTNAIGVALGHGRPGEKDERTNVSWESENPVLRFQLHVTFIDGTTTTFGSDERWRATDGPTRWDSLLPGQEFYDAREEKPLWTTAGYDDSEWQRVSKIDGPPGKLTPQRVQPIAIHDTIEPVEMWEPESGVYVYDLGQMIAGWPELTINGERETQVTLREGEKLNDDNTVEKIDYAAKSLWQEYVLKGDGTETWEPRFTYGGFRYIQIEGYPGEPPLDAIRGKVVHTTVDKGETGEFDCSNNLLNKLHENTRWAMLNNLHGQHTDSPTWEKLGWTETNIELAETLSANFSMERFWEKFLQDCRDSQLDDGNIPYVVPHEGVAFEGFGARNDPGWDAATVILAWHAYQYTGDLRFLEEHYESMKRYVRFVQTQAENGTIVRTGLGDWASPAGSQPPEGPAIVSTSCYYRSIDIISKAADLLGYDNEKESFNSIRQEIKTTFNNEFLNTSSNIYRTGETDEYRQTSNLYPLTFDIVPESYREAVAANLAYNVRDTENGHLNTGAHGLRHLLPVLSEHGYHDVAYTVATQTTYPSQGYWLENDITALLEFWPMDARSRTHDFLGSIDEWFYQYLAGIRNPIEPGFKQVKFAPKPTDDLNHAQASIETVRGTVASAWERTETPGRARTHDGLTLNVTIPGNATGTVRVPTLGGDKVRVRESRRTIWINGHQAGRNNPGVKGVERDGDAVVVEVGSGDYEFELEQLGKARR